MQISQTGRFLVVLAACSLLARSCNGLSSRSNNAVLPEAVSSAQSWNKDCVVVGGGPVGLATALTLSRKPHGYRVTVLEQSGGTSSSTSVANYNPSRSFLYNINSRGLSWFHQEHPFALEKLAERGLPPDSQGRSTILRVAADPKVPVPQPALLSMGGPLSANATTMMSYWIQRHETVDLLAKACKVQNEELLASSTSCGSITVLEGKCVRTVTSDDEGSDLITVECEDGTSYTASLVVAADGIESSVRKVLAGTTTAPSQNNNNNNKIQPTSWLQSKARQFRVRKWNSPSTGLRIKALQFPPNFSFTNTSGEVIQSIPGALYSFAGVNTGPRDRLSIGMLPLKQVAKGGTRPGNTIAPYDHAVWKQTTGTAVQAWFQHNYPRLPWSTWIDAQEWERYAHAQPTEFPPCQYSPGSAVASPRHGQTGVVLVGDACT